MRLSPRERGYDAGHRAMRKALEPIVRAGGVRCARCGEEIPSDGDWDLGHNDDRTEWTGPEHQVCNRRAGVELRERRRRRRQHVDPPPPPGW